MRQVLPVMAPDQWADAMAVRHEVFVGEQGVSVEGEQDRLDQDASTLHCVVYDGPACVGAGRLLAPAVTDDGDAGNPHIGRVAVARAARSGGVGRMIMDFLESAALEMYGHNGEVRVELSAQEQAIPFYEKLGYTVHGEPYLDEGIWHRDAFKEVLANNLRGALGAERVAS